MTATLRHVTGMGAVFGSPEEALAQARHDLSRVNHLDPLEIIEGDVSAQLADHIDQTYGDPTLNRARKLGGKVKVLERDFKPCDCNLCEFDREAPTLHHEDRAVLSELLLARVVLERDLSGDERDELVRLVGDSRRMAQRLRDARAGGRPPIAGGATPAAGFTVDWTAVALAAATAKTIASVLTSANTPVDFPEVSVSGDNTSGTLLAELVYGNNTAAGTSSAFTPLQFRGRIQTLVATAAITYTAEPTVLTVVKRWLFPWPGGPFLLQSPLGRELNSITTAATSGKLVGLRLNSSTVGNSHGYLEVEE